MSKQVIGIFRKEDSIMFYLCLLALSCAVVLLNLTLVITQITLRVSSCSPSSLHSQNGQFEWFDFCIIDKASHFVMQL